MSRRQSKMYALKLLKLAEASGEVERVGEELEALASALGPELVRKLDHPAFEEREDLLRSLAERLGLSEVMKEFLGELGARRKFRLLREIVERYRRLADEVVGRVRVRSAFPLKDGTKVLVEERVRSHWGPNLMISWEVDPELLGGLVIEGRGRRIDASLKGNLERLLRRFPCRGWAWSRRRR
ncbi:MAG TPA: hypothetical protein EYP61_06890 [Candidatus Latescibacteria bacterium]|nr:hypothetical protein [Candidatus Latescibacterota bacterium]